MIMSNPGKTRYRTVWISDVHLGSRACRPEPLLAFLSSFECDQLFLVGDIIDLWSLRRRWYWPQEHNDVVRKILKRASRGTRVTYIPGNHDERFRDYVGLAFGGVQIEREAVHTLLDGRRALVTHGDDFDAVIKNMKIITALGDVAYDVILAMNRALNGFRKKFGWPYWSLAGYIKRKVKYLCQFVSDYEKLLTQHARENACTVVVNGHIHRPEMRPIGDILYCNDGDWVESCTALVEHLDGTLELLHVEKDGIGVQPAPDDEPIAAPSRLPADALNRVAP